MISARRSAVWGEASKRPARMFDSAGRLIPMRLAVIVKNGRYKGQKKREREEGERERRGRESNL
jgi:hypothetical protein